MEEEKDWEIWGDYLIYSDIYNSQDKVPFESSHKN